jgi:deoxyribodipyrimidine photo-lyase
MAEERSVLTASRVPALRVAVRNGAPVRPDGRFVLYWCIAARRPSSNFALERAVEWAAELARPLVVLEPLRAGYAWASDRLHRFVLQGMADTQARLASKPVLYRPYVERAVDEGRGLLAALARDACVVVTDDFPCSFLPRMVAAAAERLPVRLEAVDGNGLLPMRATAQVFPTAYAFRRFLQKELAPHLRVFPRADPFARRALPRLAKLPAEVERRWPAPDAKLLAGEAAALAALPIDHAVGPAPFAGGATAARATLAGFVRDRLARYADERAHPDLDASSGLSPWLHFGHVSIHEVFAEVAKREQWKLDQLGASVGGRRVGFWRMSAAAESFLDECVTWRELGLNFCSKRDDYADFEALPDWAKATLRSHSGDPRPRTYSLAQLAGARTHDELWNAAQRELATTGRLQNYLRMLWGKRVLEWSEAPEQAFATLIELNNRFAVDGRDPNSYSGIAWVFGRYDRPWAPQRPIFGAIRYMSSANTARKLELARYLVRFGPLDAS